MSLKATPSLGASEGDSEKVVVYTVDQTVTKYLDPTFRQDLNIFYMQSAIETNDDIFDIFQTNTKETYLHEEGQRADYYKRNLAGSMVERQYINVYLRSHNQQRVYKREMYDILTYMSDLGGGFDVLLS